MEKLELKHLAPYLPYGLKVWSKKDKYSYELLALEADNCTLESGDLPFYWCSPILRPLSDLTKEIEVNGERFTSIVGLAKIHDPYLPTNWNIKIHNWGGIMYNIETNQYGIEYIIETNMGSLVHEFSYWQKLQRFSHRDNTRDRPLWVSRQLEMFQKLFEWHFDVFGLIEKGLAIDINTLSKDNSLQ